MITTNVVWIVDDESKVSELDILTLKDKHMEITVLNAKNAREDLFSLKPDVVLLNLKTAGCSIQYIMWHAQEIFSQHIPLIVIANRKWDSREFNCELAFCHLGASYVLHGPCDYQHMRVVINNFRAIETDNPVMLTSNTDAFDVDSILKVMAMSAATGRLSITNIARSVHIDVVKGEIIQANTQGHAFFDFASCARLLANCYVWKNAGIIIRQIKDPTKQQGHHVFRVIQMAHEHLMQQCSSADEMLMLDP